MSIEEEIEVYLKILAEKRQKSKNTLLSYGRDLRHFRAWLTARGITQPAAVSPAELRAYTSSLIDEGKRPATVSRSVASIRSFFQHLEETGVLIRDPSAELHAPKVLKKMPSILSEDDIKKLLAQPDDRTAKGIRDCAMAALLCDTGLRVSELISLKQEEIDLTRRVLLVQAARQRVVPFGKHTAKLLRRYEREARAQLLNGADTEAFFVNCSGGSMTRQGFWKLLKQYGTAANLKTALTPHVLRHSYAVHALSRGEDLHRLQAVMGHSDLATTHGYLSVSAEKETPRAGHAKRKTRDKKQNKKLG